MTDINVDDFYKDSARALSILYAVFPRPHTLFVEDIAGADEPDEFGMHSERHMSCFGALVWLAEEQYLRYGDNIRQEALDQAVLTGRTFTLLSSAAGSAPDPASADAESLPGLVQAEHGTHIHQLREALKARSSARLREAMLAFMRQMQGL
ncbi:MAG: hypothetical protein R3E86_19795 [Pseudomonadales bacterium]